MIQIPDTQPDPTRPEIIFQYPNPTQPEVEKPYPSDPAYNTRETKICIFLDDGISISQILIRGRLANVCTFFTNAADPPSLGRPLSSISVAAKQPKTDQSKLGQPPQKEKM